MFVLVAALFAVATPVVIHEAPTTYLLPEWSNVTADLSVNFTIAVRQQNIDSLKAAALAVSDPKSQSYGKFLSQIEIDTMTEPATEDLLKVTKWLTSRGVTSFSVKRHEVRVSTHVGTAEALLETRFSLLTTPSSDKRVLLAGSYRLPAEIDAAVATIFGLHGAPLPCKSLTISSLDSSVQVTPSVLASTYAVTQPANISGKGKQAIAEFQGEYMAKHDLKKFFSDFVPKYEKGSDDKVSAFKGVKYQEGTGVEADLDIQYMMGVAPGIATEFWAWPGKSFCSDLNDYTTALLDAAEPPLVNSISYGWQDDLTKVIDANWAKLAARGISILISSGDLGSGNSIYSTCDKSGFKQGCKAWTFSPDTSIFGSKCSFYSDVTEHAPTKDPRKDSFYSFGEGITPPKPPVLYPSWPASSPWVTAVGATRFIGQTIGGVEMATDRFGSGGGFSQLFDQSDAQWQVGATAAYIQTGATLPKFPPKGSFPPKGRGTPDVSALGEGYQIYVDGDIKAVDGTSASAPAFAGLISLINEARFRAGKPQMGFLNPFLYQHPEAFFDVVNGTNAIDDGGVQLAFGYAAAAGWDAATGLGTPHFDKLLAAAMKA